MSTPVLPSPHIHIRPISSTWYSFEANIFAPEHWVDHWGKPLPSPVILTDIFVGGNGWDFRGAIDNLRLSACYDGE